MRSRPRRHRRHRPDTRAADEAAIHAAVKEWSAAPQAKDADKFASSYAEDGVLMLEDAPDVSGKVAIREAIGGLMQDPNFSLTFEPDRVVAARSGDLAYETGTYALTLSDPKKKPSTDKGHYVVVWQKQADGAWKVSAGRPGVRSAGRRHEEVVVGSCATSPLVPAFSHRS